MICDYWGFHRIPDSNSHEDCNCNFWKSQKPIKPEVCVGSEFLNSNSSWWYPWAYPTIPWGVEQWLSHASPLFFPSKKKKKKSQWVPGDFSLWLRVCYVLDQFLLTSMNTLWQTLIFILHVKKSILWKGHYISRFYKISFLTY